LARIADGLPRTLDAEAIGGCSLGQLTIFCISLILRVIYDTLSTVGGTRGAPSMLRANDDMRMRSGAERSMIGITTSLHEVRPLGLSQQRLQLAGTTRGQSRQHIGNSPPQDRHHNRRQEDTCGVSALTPHLRAIQWPPNFKVSNVDKYEPKQDPGGWLAVYTTAAQAAGTTEDVMTAYLPIVLGQDALQWLRHLPRHCIDDWSDFSRRLSQTFNPSPTNRRNHGTSNPSGAEGMRLFGRTSKDFRP
jgi:hypothetical protein